MQSTHNRLPFSPEVWQGIQQAAARETRRVSIARKFLPHYQPATEALTVTSDTILASNAQDFLAIDEAAVVPLVEIWVELSLTPQQVEKEMDVHSARTLAIRATNFLTRGEDALIFQGQRATETDPLFTSGRVQQRSGPAGGGLLAAPSSRQIVRVRSLAAGKAVFRERTLAAVTEGCARLGSQGHYGPYALILHDVPFGDTFSPLPGTLIKTAQRLEAMLGAGFYGTGTLTDDPPTGLLISIGGNSMDLITGKQARVDYLFDDAAGLFRFRASKRFALRLKDPSAVIRLEFDASAAPAHSRSHTKKTRSLDSEGAAA